MWEIVVSYLDHPLNDYFERFPVPERPVCDDDGVVELPKGVRAGGSDAAVAYSGKKNN